MIRTHMNVFANFKPRGVRTCLVLSCLCAYTIDSAVSYHPCSLELLRHDRAIAKVASIFAKTSLQDDFKVDAAFANFEHYLQTSEFPMEELVAGMEHVPFLLDFVLSGANDDLFYTFKTALMNTFPTTPGQYFSSIHSFLLARFSSSIILPYARVVEAPPTLLAHQHSIANAATILEAVSRLPDSAEGRGVSSIDPKGIAKRKAQSKRRSATPTVSAFTINRNTFLDLGMTPPESAAQAADITDAILQEQRAILQFYLQVFRSEPHRTYFHDAYLPTPPNEERVYPPLVDDEEHTQSPPVDFDTLPATDSLPCPADRRLMASLYLENIEGFGEWPITASTRALRDLRNARNEDGKKFKIIVKKIRELSNGHFSNDNHKKLTGVNVGVPVFEAKMSRDLRLVYQIHCASDFETNVERQVIRIFGIYTHAKLDARLWDALSHTLAGQGAEYKKRCAYRNRPTYRRGDNVVLPGEFPARNNDIEERQLSQLPNDSDLTTEQSTELRALVLEGYVKFSKTLLKCIWADLDVVHVFNVSPHEKDIIEYTDSCVVIGRSGTGKTTTMLYKMLGIERAWQTGLGEDAGKPRQLFVTQSRTLANKVEEYYRKLQLSLSTTHIIPSELKRIATHMGAVRTRSRLIDSDEELYWRSDLPQRYGALTDEHFPMFITYDHLCRLLENEFDATLAAGDTPTRRQRLLRDAFRHGDRKLSVVHDVDGILQYGAFRAMYWSHFPQDLRKGLNPNIVFSEFLGVIQGSLNALHSDKGYLDREAYCNITCRSLIMDPDQRNAIYTLFLLYRTKKGQRWERDAADRTRELIHALRQNGLPGLAVDFLYVDEAQDNLLADTFVLSALCQNSRGMFWAGDTAQTISAGSTFQFSELRAFLYEHVCSSASLWTSLNRCVRPQAKL
ncbi:hypothetical protein C2E23DRAFT_901145 [Lenzites betulinus]|nr:hypothetical protein C2E23DRAFT_901145 [Lenzites betulinus]